MNKTNDTGCAGWAVIREGLLLFGKICFFYGGLRLEKMKAARFYKVGEPLKIERVPIPEIGSEEVLVDVKACGICGSDIHIIYEGVTPTPYTPITLGHEPSGVIEKVGGEVTDWKTGDRVTVNPFLTCGKCINCLSGNSQICLSRHVVGIHEEGALAEF